MTDQQLCGKWIGAYIYGNEYDEHIKGKTVAFEMELTVVKGLIKGACTDAESITHFEQPATIEGAIIDDTIKFIKRYPHYWQHEQAGPRFLPKLPSQEVNYSGQFVNDGFEGEWEIISNLVNARGEPVAYKGYGRWYMKKAIADFGM
jgi:hypothetical protein